MLVPAHVPVSLPLKVDIEVVVGVPVNIRLDPVEEAPLAVAGRVVRIGKPEVSHPFTPKKAVHADLVPVERGFRGLDQGQDLIDTPPHIAVGVMLFQLTLQTDLEGADTLQVIQLNALGPFFIVLFKNLGEDPD